MHHEPNSPDPWMAADPWHRFQRSAVHEKPRNPALLTIRGPYIMVHDVALAREYLGPLQAAHLHGIAAAAPTAITVASAAGEGWRSKIMSRKRLKEAETVPVTSAKATAAKLPGECFHFDIDAEVHARLAALEIEIRAQVEKQVNEGIPLHHGRDLVTDAQHTRCTAAKHIFKNQVPFDDVPVSQWRHLQRSRSLPSSSSVPPDERSNKLQEEKILTHLGTDGLYSSTGEGEVPAEIKTTDDFKNNDLRAGEALEKKMDALLAMMSDVASFSGTSGTTTTSGDHRGLSPSRR